MLGRRSTGTHAAPGRLPGHGAFAKDDVEDAERRRPDIDLSAYAAGRCLDLLESRNAAGFFAALPLDPQLQFNVLRGTIPGGEHGILFHHVLPFPLSADGRLLNAGTVHGFSFTPAIERPRLRDALNMIPVVGDVIDLASSERNRGGDDPLAGCIGIPCTVAAVLVPEAALVELTIDNRPKPAVVAHHREKLADRGLDDWTLLAPHEPDAAVVDRLLSATTRDVLHALGARPYAKLELRYGTLLVRVNGYLSDPAELDALAQAACRIAAELRAAGELMADR